MMSFWPMEEMFQIKAWKSSPAMQMWQELWEPRQWHLRRPDASAI
jgi:hypothetical protein